MPSQSTRDTRKLVESPSQVVVQDRNDQSQETMKFLFAPRSLNWDWSKNVLLFFNPEQRNRWILECTKFWTAKKMHINLDNTSTGKKGTEYVITSTKGDLNKFLALESWDLQCYILVTPMHLRLCYMFLTACTSIWVKQSTFHQLRKFCYSNQLKSPRPPGTCKG